MSAIKAKWSLPNNDSSIIQILRSIYQLDFLPKWILLIIIAAVLRTKETGYETDIKIIKWGNKLFKRTYPENIHNDYATYVTLFPGSVNLFGKVSHPNWYKGQKLMEIGSGLGQYTHCFAKAGASHVTGIEFQEEKVRFSNSLFPPKQNDNFAYLQGEAEHLPFSDNTFDGVYSHAVFEHISDPALAFQEMRRVIKPYGYAFLTIDYLHGPWGDHLYDYIYFPWASLIIEENSLCKYWSRKLIEDQAKGKMKFYPEKCQISSLGEGSEIHLNRWTSDQIEQSMLKSGLIIEKKVPSMLIAAYLPFFEKLPFKFHLHGAGTYRLRKP